MLKEGLFPLYILFSRFKIEDIW